MYTKEILDKFNFLHSNKVNNEIYKYLSSCFSNLEIEILGDYKGNLLDLMNQRLLEGWCWQTTETAILFMKDKDYIERGYLKFNRYNNYYHSWIVFNYNDKSYVFDPCLKILCEKDVYYNVFDIEVKGRVTAKVVKEYFVNYINNPPIKKQNLSSNAEMFITNFLSKYSNKKNKDEVVIYDKEDVNAPMYRNGVGYRTTLEKGKIKKLVAHYYLNG